jgi:hypothetical protein
MFNMVIYTNINPLSRPSVPPSSQVIRLICPIKIGLIHPRAMLWATAIAALFLRVSRLNNIFSNLVPWNAISIWN